MLFNETILLVAMTTITERDEEVLFALARCVRFFTLQQIARTWWNSQPSGEANARRRISQLLDADLIGRQHIFASELPGLTKAIFTWQLGDMRPNYGAVSWKLVRRWKSAPKRQTAYFATTKLANRYGGRSRGRIKHLNQATHDLGVSEMYLNFFTTCIERREDWVGEDIFSSERREQKLPDAVLRNQSGKLYRVLEFGGSYDTQRVKEFHLDCERRELPYELW